MKDNTKSKLASVEKENGKLRGLLKEVEDKNLYLEAYSRRENIKFENIPEEPTGKEDTETVLRSFMERDLGFSDAADVEIRVHRLGKRRETETNTRQIPQTQGLWKASIAWSSFAGNGVQNVPGSAFRDR